MIENEAQGSLPSGVVGAGGTTCPAPVSARDHIVMGHGAGGRMSTRLLEDVFLAGLDADARPALEDSATLALPASMGADGARLAFTTDSFVVHPLFFPGGDIGRLAVSGTVNDLAVAGARPRWISAAFILEEGIALDDVRRIVASMRTTCREADVVLVTGDTKVVERGKGDGVFITTSGIGIIPPPDAPSRPPMSVHNARSGDRVLVSGTIGDHGIAILSTRDGLAFDTILESDVAPLHRLTAAILETCPDVRFMRDATRGGVSAALFDLARASNVGIIIDERAIPLRDEVRGACEMLGLDPLYVANEGKIVVVVPPESADRALEAMRRAPHGENAACIGEVVARRAGLGGGDVTMRTLVGGERVVPELSGEQLPRIC